MEQPAPTRMTVAEFVLWDDGTETRYELVGGRAVAMNPPLARHVVIAMNIARALDARLAAPCRAFVGGGLARDDGDDEYRLPDVFVSCTPAGRWYFERPRLVAEVLSGSTEKEDRSTKLDFYRSFATVQAIMLVWQDARRIELHTRAGEVWEVRPIIGGGTVALPDLGVALPLDEIYAET